MEPLDDDSTDGSRVRQLGSHVFIGASDLVFRELSFSRVPDEPCCSAAALQCSIMRPVLFIGGSVLVPELSPQRLEAYADVITTLVEAHEICVVSGGGTPSVSTSMFGPDLTSAV